MKYVKLLICLFLFIQLKAQDQPLLISKTLVGDYSMMDYYGRFTEKVSGESIWKSSVAYVDNIEVYDITYLSDGLKVHGYLIQPKAEGLYPSIIYNRGGNRDFGSISLTSAVIRLGKIANEGYVVIASQYRGNVGGQGQEEFGGAEVNDIAILPEVLKEIHKADTSNIGMYGWSRGGMMTYIALTQMNNIRAAAVGGAVSDSYEVISDRPDMETGVYAQLIPYYEANKEAELDARSAVKWAHKFSKDVPILMLHGNADWRVKPEQSLRMAMEFEKVRIPYRLVMFEGGDHGLSEHQEEKFEQVISWFDRFLKDNEPVPEMEYHGR